VCVQRGRPRFYLDPNRRLIVFKYEKVVWGLLGECEKAEWRGGFFFEGG